MSKKPKRAKRKTGLSSQTALVDKWLSQASNQVFKEDYVGAVDTCQRLLNYLPQKAQQRAEALYYLATAQSMLQNFPQAYEAYTEAIAVTPEDAQ